MLLLTSLATPWHTSSSQHLYLAVRITESVTEIQMRSAKKASLRTSETGNAACTELPSLIKLVCLAPSHTDPITHAYGSLP
eukprot:3025761-Amphidinium_carterae.2